MAKVISNRVTGMQSAGRVLQNSNPESDASGGELINAIPEVNGVVPVGRVIREVDYNEVLSKRREMEKASNEFAKKYHNQLMGYTETGDAIRVDITGYHYDNMS